MQIKQIIIAVITVTSDVVVVTVVGGLAAFLLAKVFA